MCRFVLSLGVCVVLSAEQLQHSFSHSRCLLNSICLSGTSPKPLTHIFTQLCWGGGGGLAGLVRRGFHTPTGFGQDTLITDTHTRTHTLLLCHEVVESGIWPGASSLEVEMLEGSGSEGGGVGGATVVIRALSVVTEASLCTLSRFSFCGRVDPGFLLPPFSVLGITWANYQ